MHNSTGIIIYRPSLEQKMWEMSHFPTTLPPTIFVSVLLSWSMEYLMKETALLLLTAQFYSSLNQLVQS